MTFIELITWINLITLLAYVPLVCYLDIRYREVEVYYWIPMVLVCLPINAYLYLTGFWIPWYALIFTAAMVVTFWWAMKAGYLEGADFLYLVMLSSFWVLSPFPNVHGLMQPVFYIYFAVTSVFAAVVVLAYNVASGKREGLVWMMSHYPNGVPYMLPIGAAFLLSVVMG